MERESDGPAMTVQKETPSQPPDSAMADPAAADAHLLTVLMDRIETGVRVDDPSGRVLRWNAAYARMFPDQSVRLTVGAPAPLTPPPADGKVLEFKRPDGRRYRCEQQRLPDGSLLTLWSDLTGRYDTHDQQGEGAVLHALLEGLDQGVLMVDADLTVVAVNSRMLHLFEVPDAVFVSPRFEDLLRYGAAQGELGDGDVEAVVSRRLEMARRADVSLYEHVRPNGRVMEVRTQPLPQGGFVRTYTDITERRRAEREIAQKTELLRITLENMGQGIALFDADLHVITYNNRALDLLGIPELMAQNFPTLEDITRFQLVSRQLVMPADAPDFGDDVDAKVRYLMTRLARPAKEVTYTRPQGDGRYIEVRIIPLADGRQVRTYTDVSERLVADEAVRQSREILKGVIDAIPALIDVKDRDRQIQLVNRHYAEMQGPVAVDRDSGTMPDRDADLDRQVIATGRGIPFFEQRRCDDAGRSSDWLTTKMPLTDERGNVSHIVTVALDITERRQAKEALARKSSLLQAVLGSIGQGLSAFDDNLRLVTWNDRFTEMFGYSPELCEEGRPFQDFIRINAQRGEYGSGDIEDYVQGRVDLIRTQLPHRLERTLSNGTVVEIHGMPMQGGGFVTTYTDVSERKRGEEELRAAKERAESALAELRITQESLIQAEKMASLAQLVAGVAHEVNTPIGVSLTAVSHLGEEVRRIRELFDAGRVRRSDFQEFLDIAWESTRMILTNIDRAVALIQSFKQVAVDQASAERRPFDLADYVDEVLLSLRPRLRRTKVTVTADVPPDIVIDSYPGPFAQVLSNLIINALVHGFDEGREGRIAITAREVQPGLIELHHRDDGRGIPAAILPHVFDPFFTTKRGAGASGLGLNICYNIMTGPLQGAIAVESEEGRGTTFVLRFPRSA